MAIILKELATVKPWNGEGNGAQNIKKGDFVLEIVDAKEHVSKAGKPNIKLRYEVVSDQEGQETSSDGEGFDSYYTVKPEALGLSRTRAMLNAAGWESNAKGHVDVALLIGKKIKARLRIEESDSLDADGEKATYLNVRVSHEESFDEPRKSAKAAPKAMKRSAAPVAEVEDEDDTEEDEDDAFVAPPPTMTRNRRTQAST